MAGIKPRHNLDHTNARTVSSPPPVLYHYTTQAGLLGILQSDSVWATKIHYLNDASEYQLALDIADSVLQGLLKGERNAKKRRKITSLLSNLRMIGRMNVCVCSFSAQRDLLSQWRAYAGDATGYSMGFRTTHIQEQAKEQSFVLERCIYEELQQRELVEQIVAGSLEQDFNTIPAKVDPARPNTVVALPVGGDFAMRFARLAPVIKSNAFYEEAEWRLVSDAGMNFDQMFCRPGRSMLIPYYPFSLGSSIEAYLESVTVGPTPHPTLAEGAVLALLARSGAASTVKIHVSKVPYRSW
jgi:hypothetical protein